MQPIGLAPPAAKAGRDLQEADRRGPRLRDAGVKREQLAPVAAEAVRDLWVKTNGK